MSRVNISVIPNIHIPHYLAREIQAKLVYIDERITSVKVEQHKNQITLSFDGNLDGISKQDISNKVNRVVDAMAQDAFEPELKTIENYLDRPVSNTNDPMDQLYESGEVVSEGEGYFILGPLLSSLIDYFSFHLTGIAESFGAKLYRFPTLIIIPLNIIVVYMLLIYLQKD